VPPVEVPMADNQVKRLAGVRIVSQVVALSQSLDGSLLYAMRFNMERAAAEGFLQHGLSTIGVIEEGVPVRQPSSTVILTLTVNLAQGPPPGGAAPGKSGKPEIRYAYRLNIRAWDGVLSDADLRNPPAKMSWSDDYNGSAVVDKVNTEVMSHARTLASVMAKRYPVK